MYHEEWLDVALVLVLCWCCAVLVLVLLDFGGTEVSYASF